MTKIKYFLILIICSAEILICQSNKSQIEQFGTGNNANVFQSGMENVCLLNQIGNFNNSSAEQKGNGNLYFNSALDLSNTNDVKDLEKFSITEQNNNKSENISSAFQNGNYNEAVVINLGDYNSSQIFQSGYQNTISSKNSGDDNYLQLIQDGNMNLIDQKISSSGAAYELTQNGSHNKLYQFDNSSDGINLRITQQGNWIQTIIINGR